MHILYAALFRLAIIASGFGCVVMGYRLFVMGVMPKNGSQIDAQAGDIRLSLKNAAPGTCFAAFGVILIITMLVQGNPGKKIVETQTIKGVERVVTWRSDTQDIQNAMILGLQHQQAGKLDEAIQAYAMPLKDSSLPLGVAATMLRAIAGVYLTLGRLEEAIAYASLANQADPDSAPGLALTARIQLGRGKIDEATRAMSSAAKIDPIFRPELDRIKERRNDGN
jgi:tetratricopeptide (TPR) repeat protein